MSTNRDSDVSSVDQPLTDDETSGTIDANATSQQHLLSIPLTPINNPNPSRQTVPLNNTASLPRPARPTSAKEKSKDLTLTLWWQEIGACFLVVSSLLAIVATIKTVENRPLPKLPFSVSINALIAVFVAIAQASIVFVIAEGISQSKWTWFLRPHNLHDFLTYDNASRGPWGALKLIWTLRGRPVIASLGAFVIITAIILDPISQQLIELYDCFDDIPESIATLPRTSYYDYELRALLAASQIPGSMATTGLVGAAAVGQFSSSPPQPPFSCQTGNCTFPGQYSSIGYCSRCQNVSSYLRVANAHKAAGPNSCTVNIDLGPLPQYNKPGDNSYYSLSNSTYNFTLINVYINGTNGQSVSNMSQFISKYDQPTGSIVMLWLDNALKIELNQNCSVVPQARASQCMFYSCIHTFEANVTNSRLIERTVARDVAFGPPENLLNRYGTTADLQCAGDQAREGLSQLGYEFNSSTRWIKYNITAWPWVPEGPDRYKYYPSLSTLIPTSAGLDNGMYVKQGSVWNLTDKARQIVPSRCIYTVDYQTALVVESGLEYYWDGKVTRNENAPGFLGSPFALSLFAAGAYKSGQDALGQISALMQNMSDSMTTFMRWHGNLNGSEPVRGQTHHYAVCVGVRWAFLAYIAAVTGLLLIFFVAVVIQTRRTFAKEAIKAASGQSNSNRDHNSTFHDFKSNALAVLFHGLDEQSQKALGDIGATNRVKELEDEGKRDMFMLVSTGQGWKLSRVNEHRRK